MFAACKSEFESDDETWGTWTPAVPEPVPVQQAETKLGDEYVEFEVEVASDDEEFYGLQEEQWQETVKVKAEEDHYYKDSDDGMMMMMAEPVMAEPVTTASRHSPWSPSVAANRNRWHLSQHLHRRPQQWHIKPKPQMIPKPKPMPIKPQLSKPQPIPQLSKPRPIFQPQTQTQGHVQGHGLRLPAPRVVPPPILPRRRRPQSRPSKAPHVAAAEKRQLEAKVEQEHQEQQLMQVQSQSELELPPAPAPIPMSHLLGSGLSSKQLIEIAGYYLDAADHCFESEVEKRKSEEAIFNLGVEIGKLSAPEKR